MSEQNPFIKVLTDKSRELEQAREESARAKETHSAASQKEDRVERELMELLDDAGLRTFGRDDGVSFAKKETLYAKVEDSGDLIAALIEEGLDADMLERKVNMGRLNEMVRQRVDQGIALPPGSNFYVKRYISRTAR